MHRFVKDFLKVRAKNMAKHAGLNADISQTSEGPLFFLFYFYSFITIVVIICNTDIFNT